MEDGMDWKGAIFDMDGVVVDTVPIHYKAWKKMADEYGRTSFDFEAYKEGVDGIPRVDGASFILQGEDEKTILEASDKKQKYFLEFLSEEKIPQYDSTIQFIHELKDNGIKVAVISSSKNAPYILETIGLAKHLDALVCGHDITKGKPDPQIFLMAAERMNLKPACCVVFEDAVLGVEAGKNGGMYTVGIDRYENPDRLQTADQVIKDLGEITYESFKSELFTFDS